MIKTWSLLPWLDGEPTDPGLYIVIGADREARMLADLTGTEPIATIRGMCRVRSGPRGGRRKPRWMSPPGREFVWERGWQHIALATLAGAWCGANLMSCVRCGRFLPEGTDADKCGGCP